MSARKPRRPGTFGPGNQVAVKPEGKRRVPVSFRLPPEAAEKLRAHVLPGLSQGDIVAALLLRWDPEREPVD